MLKRPATSNIRIWFPMTVLKLARNANSDGLINCLRQPGQLRNQPPKSMRLNFNQLIKSCDTGTIPATKTKSIGLPADALVPCFLLVI
jgi:hypothetical protein